MSSRGRRGRGKSQRLDGPTLWMRIQRSWARRRVHMRWGWLGDWVGKPLVAVVITAFITAFLALFTGIGEDIKERVNPTSASVTGVVVKNGRAVARTPVKLDCRPAGTTDSFGGFVLLRVGDGFHTLTVTEGRSIVYVRGFAIERRQTQLQLEPADLALAAPIVLPGANDRELCDASRPEVAGATEEAVTPTPTPLPVTEKALTPGPTPPQTPAPTPTPDPARLLRLEVVPGQAGTPEGDHSQPELVTLRITGPPETLARIERVTYYLPAGFQPQVVSRYDARDGFALTVVADGETATALVVLDGRTVQLDPAKNQ
jgi:hypothetical protein